MNECGLNVSFKTPCQIFFVNGMPKSALFIRSETLEVGELRNSCGQHRLGCNLGVMGLSNPFSAYNQSLNPWKLLIRYTIDHSR